MSYSCTDFTDDVLDDLKIKVPVDAQDDPLAQAKLARAEIQRLQGDAFLYKNLAGRLDFLGAYLENLPPQVAKALRQIARGYKPDGSGPIPPRK